MSCFSVYKARICCSLRFLANPNVCSLRLVSSSTSSSSDQEKSFTVSYLMDSLGLSPKAALSASKLVDFKTSEKPDKVIRLLKGYGFTQSHISTLVRVRPAILVADSEKTILPKLEFFKAKGVSWPEFAKKISVFPTILHSSLEKQIIPGFEFFREFFRSDEKAITAIKRYPDLLTRDVEKLKPKIEILREHGVPDLNIAALFQNSPNYALLSVDRLRELVEEVAEMGFDASRPNFVAAVSARASMSKSRWESKIDAYKKWGFSEEDVLRAFGRCPCFLRISLDKIAVSLDFYINKMGFSPRHIANQSMVVSFSLKKRLVPRYLVFKALQSKGLVKKEVSLNTLFGPSEKKFLQKFVVPYEEEAPELLKLYNEKPDGPEVKNV